MKSGFCESENQIGSELLQVSEVSHKSWKFAIRSIIKRLRLTCELPPVDSGYRGEIHAIISNVSNKAQTISKDTRVGQLVITPIIIVDFVFDLGKERGTDAFGSSGE